MLALLHCSIAVNQFVVYDNTSFNLIYDLYNFEAAFVCLLFNTKDAS